jgi:hypothetical protein
MGDDDIVFFPDNLLTVLNKFDHRQPYYIGSLSESHLQNIYFSYGMAYGSGSFAISRPLARMQDGCLLRYPALYGSDDRIQACMGELGVPFTKHLGFHQYDVYDDLLARSPCQKPTVYYLSSARRQARRGGETTVTRYKRWRHPNETRPACWWDIADPDAHLDHIVVLKKPDPGAWDRVIFRATSFLFLLLHCIQITATHDAFAI